MRRIRMARKDVTKGRWLVPMPTRKAAPPSTPAPAPLAAMKTWHAFASATVWCLAKGPLIVIGFLVGLNWLCDRFPKTMYWIVLIVEGLMSGRRRR